LFAEVNKERLAQLKAWGVQNWPGLDQTLLHRDGGCTPERMCEEYGIPSERRAQSAVDILQQRKDLTWGHITTEEFSEAISEFDVEKRRYELIQTIAVILGWVDCIDRHKLEMQVEGCSSCGGDHDVWTLPMKDPTTKEYNEERYGVCPVKGGILYLS